MSELTHLSNRQIAAQTLRKSRDVRRARRVRRWSPRGVAAIAVSFGALVAAFGAMPSAGAAVQNVDLATASTYAVLAGSTITNTGSSVIAGSVGLSPGSAITGFPPGSQSSGVQNVDDATAVSAKSDLTAAYLVAAGETPTTSVASDLGGQTLVSGIYTSSSSLSLTGTLTLNGGGSDNAVFVFQAGSTLVAASGSRVVLENGAQACHVFWQVGSSATLGTTSEFSGTVLASTSITLNTGAHLVGRVLAQNGAVTLDDNSITVPVCSSAVTSSTTTTTAVSSATSSTTTTTAKRSGSTTSTTISSHATTSTTAPPSGSTTSTTTPVTTTTVVAPTTTTTVIPSGPPATGFGGTAPPGGVPHTPLAAGALSLSVLSGALALRQRRRRHSSVHEPTDETRPN